MNRRALACVFVVFAGLVLIAGLGIWLFRFNGIMPWTHTIGIGSPQVLGQRKDSHGDILQQLIRQTDSSSTEVLLTPEGPRWAVQYRTRYYLEERDRSRKELSFVSDLEFHYYISTDHGLEYCDKCLPVEESSLWVGVGIDPVDSKTGHIVVFDDGHLVSHRTFDCVPTWETEKPAFSFEKGNQKIIVNSASGPKEYDVLHDQISVETQSK